ncbi:hypothetical protein Tco_0227837 [Tanacetum coccineum]
MIPQNQCLLPACNPSQQDNICYSNNKLIYEVIEEKFQRVLKEKKELEDLLKENLQLDELFNGDENSGAAFWEDNEDTNMTTLDQNAIEREPAEKEEAKKEAAAKEREEAEKQKNQKRKEQAAAKKKEE